MARFLLASQPIHGHVQPLVPVARELVRRGHDVRWYTGAKYRAAVAATGAAFEPFRAATDFDDADLEAAFPGHAARRGLAQTKFDMLHLFVRSLEPQARDLQAILDRWPADAILAEQSVASAVLLHERGGPPCATLGISVVSLPSADTAPNGLALPPDASARGRLRNRALSFLATRVVFGDLSREAERQCRRIGVRPRPFGPVVSPHLVMQLTVPGFEYPLSDAPSHLHFVGPVLPDPPADFRPPAWWDDVTRADRPVVLVTQGTAATDARDLVAPTLAGLAHEDVLVVAAGLRDPAVLGALPTNARVEAFVPFGPLWPFVDAFVTNGGYGGVQQALARGVPIVAGGATEDKPEVANRVAFAGVGVNLRTATPTPAQVQGAVRAVRADPAFRARARALAADIARTDAPRTAADLVEELARTARPVVGRGAVAEPVGAAG